MRHLKQQKIFGYGSYDEFFTDYFKRDLVAVEDLNKVRLITNARKKYENRHGAAHRKEVNQFN